MLAGQAGSVMVLKRALKQYSESDSTAQLKRGSVDN
jgi:hypothetical protein